jgi:hypothetical protein
VKVNDGVCKGRRSSGSDLEHPEPLEELEVLCTGSAKDVYLINWEKEIGQAPLDITFCSKFV